MSYCVNCGVELDKSAKKCALCGTRVINPNEPKKDVEEAPTPFSETPFIPAPLKRRFVAYIITVVMLIPNIVCTLVNAAFFRKGFWSFYVSATCLLLWVVFVFPFYTKKLRPYLMWAFDTFSVCAYVFFFFAMGHDSGEKSWYLSTALPIILSFSAVVLFYIFWCRRKKRHWVLKFMLITADAALISFAAGLILDVGYGLENAFPVGAIISVSCAVLVCFLAYCYRSRHMRAWLSKKFFV